MSKKAKPKKPEAEEPRYVSQLQLFCAIMKELSNQGITHLLPREMNACIAAANLVIAEIDQPERKVIDNMGVQLWRLCDHTGLSSLYMAEILQTQHPKTTREYAYPRAPGDFGRCLGLLRAVPGFRDPEKLQVLRQCGPEWAGIVAHWFELQAFYEAELPSGQTPHCAALLDSILRAAAPSQPPEGGTPAEGDVDGD